MKHFYSFGGIAAFVLALSISGGTAFALTPAYIGPPVQGSGTTSVESSKVFTQHNATVTSVDATKNTFTISYLTSCSVLYDADGKPIACPAGAPNETLSPDNVLVLDKFSLIVASASRIGERSAITVYTKTEGGQQKAYLVRLAYNTLVYPTGTYPNNSGYSLPPGAGGVGTSTSPGNSANTPGAIISGFARDLSVGTQSDDVHALQEKLRQLGIFPMATPSTGYFGPATKSAVIEYQRTHGIPATGYVGPLTRQALNIDQ